MKDKGSCPCGLYGSIVRLSPSIAKGGSSRDNVYRITSFNSPEQHNVRFLWSDTERRFVATCLREDGEVC